MEPNPIVIAGHSLVLREWTEDDAPVMQELFDAKGRSYDLPRWEHRL